MSQEEKLPLEQKFVEVLLNGTKQRIPAIDIKWVEEESRTFSVYPGLPTPENGTLILGEEEIWLELARFVQDDLLWLLSLSHHKFWSHMIYSEKAHHLLVSFLKKYPPHCLKKNLLINDEMRNIFQEIEHLVFLVFLRLSTEKESESCFIKNLGEILYNNYLFTVPVLLDIGMIYGISNPELVKQMFINVITLAPNFLNDFQEIVPHFFQVLSVIKEKFSIEQHPNMQGTKGVHSSDLFQDLIIYLHDSVASIQLFLKLCSKGCKMFCKSEFILEIVSFYSNVLPKIYNTLSKKNYSPTKLKSSLFMDLFESIRVDLLIIVKSVFDFLSSEANKILNRRDEYVDEYLTIMMELLSEPDFLSDYNGLYCIEFEIDTVTQDCINVDTMKVNHIIEGVALVVNKGSDTKVGRNKCLKYKWNSTNKEPEVTGVKLNSLVTQVKDILPHLEEDFLKECLKYYKYDTERVIAAILETSLPPKLKEFHGNVGRIQREEHEALALMSKEINPNVDSSEWSLLQVENLVECTGKHNSKYKTLKEMLDDRSEINETRDRYAQLALLTDDTYDDEYDDTYDENIDVSVRDADEIEKERRPFVVPRVLRPREELEEEVEDDVESEDESGDYFVQNPVELRERRSLRKGEKIRADAVERDRGKSESKQAVLSRQHFKETHKSYIGNHNRRSQADRKRRQGIIPS